MAGWIKMSLGTEVDLGPGDFVLERDPAPLPKKERGPCSSVGVMGGTDRHTDIHTETAVTTMYISRRLRLTRNVMRR